MRLNIISAALTTVAAMGMAAGTAAAYDVQPGDTLSEIAETHGTSVAVLAQANNIPNPDFIYVGQQLDVGDSGERDVRPRMTVKAPAPKVAKVAPKSKPAPTPHVAPESNPVTVPTPNERSAPKAKQKRNVAPKQSAAQVGGGSAKQEIMRRESSGNPNAVNPSSGAVGLFQCLPSAHSDCPAAGDAAGQSAWADKYVAGRYGSWDAALSHHNAKGWY